MCVDRWGSARRRTKNGPRSPVGKLYSPAVLKVRGLQLRAPVAPLSIASFRSSYRTQRSPLATRVRSGKSPQALSVHQSVSLETAPILASRTEDEVAAP